MSERRLKILAFFPTVGRGGVTRVVETLLPALQPYADITILGQTFNENGQPIQYPKDMPFIQVEPGSLIPPHPYQFTYIINNSQVFIEHAKSMQDDFDLIWCISPWFSIGAADFVEFRKPLVINIADFAFDHIDMGEYLTSYFRKVAPLMALRADYAIFSSDFQRHWAEDYYGYTRSETIHYCTGFSPLPQGGGERHPGLPDEYLLAFHPMGHKDPVTIIRAFQHARSRNRAVPPLVLAGIGTQSLLAPPRKATPEATHIVNLINRNEFCQLGRDVFVAGYVAEEAIEDLYRRAKIALVASRSEGDLSGSVHEAVHYKVPLVYGNLPVFTEQLINRVHGLEFPLGDWRSMADAILHTLEYPEAARRRAGYAFNDLERRTVDDVARNFMEAFERIAERGKVTS